MRTRVFTCFLLCSAMSLVGQNSEPLGDVARRLRAEKQRRHQQQSAAGSSLGTQPNGRSTSDAVQHVAASNAVSAGFDAGNINEYREHARKLLFRDQFDELERIAASARNTKSRFSGGSWKLNEFYGGLGRGTDQSASEAEYLSTIEHLKRWIAAKPQSVTPRIALANVYLDYAWKARGGNYADLVDENAWKPFQERLEISKQLLDEASKLNEKCPHLFLVMQRVARGLGKDLRQIAAITDQASSFEPLYHYYYNEHAFTLQPRWHGEEGDSEKYAEQVADKIGGKQGAAIYFLLASSINCVGCSESKSAFSRMSWPRIKEGYAALEELYGTSRLRQNQFAHLTIRAVDRSAALKAFMQIGDNWDKDVWRTKSYFDSSREWATVMPPDLLAVSDKLAEIMRDPEAGKYLMQVTDDMRKSSGAAQKQCMELIKDDTQPFGVAVRLSKDGAAEQVRAWPPTRLSECILPRLTLRAASPPPLPSYWIMFDIVPKPVTFRTPVPAIPEVGS